MNAVAERGGRAPIGVEAAPILVFDPLQEGVFVDLMKLVPSRLLIQGSSGAGKSWLIRYLLEQTYGRIQQFVFDPEGEFVTLREQRDYVVASAGAGGDVRAHPSTAAALAEHLVKLQASAIFDIYDLPTWGGAEDDDVPTRQGFVGNFLNRLLTLPKDQWRPALVICDEAHELAPQAGRPPSRKPMELLVSKGRKRGLCAIFATQRISKLSKNASDMQNVLIGLTGLDTDVKRAGELLGFDRVQREQLKRLEEGKGEFFAFGPAISREVVKVRSGPVESYHPKPGEVAPPTPPPRGAIAELVAQLADIPTDDPDDDTDDVEALRAQIHELRAGAPARTGPTDSEIAGRVAAARREGFDEGVRIMRSDLGPHALALYHALANGGAPALPEDSPAASHPAPPERSTPPTPRPRPTPPPPSPRGGAAPAGSKVASVLMQAGLTGPQRRILESLAWWESIGIAEPIDAAVAVVANYAPSNSSYQKALGQLKTGGLVEYPSPGVRRRTEAGRKASPEVDRPKSRAALHAVVLDQLTGPQRRILEPLLQAYPKEVPLDELATAAGYEESNSSFQKARGQLKTLELITYPGQRRNRAADFLFPKGVR